MSPATTQGFHKWRWRLVALWIVLFTAVNAYAVHQGHQAHAALCAYQANLAAQVVDTKVFLVEHPDGLATSHGEILISAAQLRLTLARQQATLASLESLNCQ
jgi:hypothetical protein